MDVYDRQPVSSSSSGSPVVGVPDLVGSRSSSNNSHQPVSSSHRALSSTLYLKQPDDQPNVLQPSMCYSLPPPVPCVLQPGIPGPPPLVPRVLQPTTPGPPPPVPRVLQPSTPGPPPPLADAHWERGGRDPGAGLGEVVVQPPLQLWPQGHQQHQQQLLLYPQQLQQQQPPPPHQQPRQPVSTRGEPAVADLAPCPLPSASLSMGEGGRGDGLGGQHSSSRAGTQDASAPNGEQQEGTHPGGSSSGSRSSSSSGSGDGHPALDGSRATRGRGRGRQRRQREQAVPPDVSVSAGAVPAGATVAGCVGDSDQSTAHAAAAMARHPAAAATAAAAGNSSSRNSSVTRQPVAVQ